MELYKKILDNPAARYVIGNTVSPIVGYIKNEAKDLVTRNGSLGLGALGPRPWRRANSVGIFVDKDGVEHLVEPNEIFGLPVHNRVWLDNGKDLIIFDDAIITITKTKNIIKTYLPGYAGSVKEHMYDEDYNINIVCSIASDSPMVYNSNKLILALRNLECADEIDISNQYLNECFDVYKIEITDFSMKQSERFSNIIEVDINAVSFSGFLPIAW